MDKAMLEAHLAQAERHVAKGEEHIRRQHQIICDLQAGGHDVSTAIAVLDQFEEMLLAHMADRDRLRQTLGQPL